MKYSTIPVVGSLISCLAGSLNAPSAIVDGEFNGDFNTSMNYVSFVCFVAFCYLYGITNQYSIIPFVIFLITFIIDSWDEASDFIVEYTQVNAGDIWNMVVNKCKGYKKVPIVVTQQNTMSKKLK